MPRLYKLGPRSLWPSTAIGASGLYEGAYLPLLTPQYSYASARSNYFSNGVVRQATNYSELQNWINTCDSGDTIEVPAGTVINSFIDFPNRGPNFRCMIRSGGHSFLPSPGTRVADSDESKMPTFRHPNNDYPTLRFAAAANGFYFVGINFDSTGTGSSTKMVELGERNNSAETEPYNLFIDRCRFYTPPGFNASRLLTLCGRYLVLRDSWLWNAPVAGKEAQAIWGTNSTGQWLIENNFIMGSGENFMVGGNTPPRGYDGIPRDVTVRYNHFYLPLYLNQYDSANWDGVLYAPKNLFELKYGLRFLVEWNFFQNWFFPAQNSWMNIKAVSQSGNFDEASTTDLVFRNNSAANVAGGMVLGGNTEGSTGLYGRHVLAYNRQWGTSDPILTGSTSRQPQLRVLGGTTLTEMPGLRVVHNTMLGYGSHMMQFNSQAVCPEMHFRDNLVDYGQYGIKGTPAIGNSSIAQHMPNGVVTGNIMLGSTSSSYPAGNLLRSSYDDIPVAGGSALVNSYGQGDCRLDLSSPYLTYASDGTEPGVGREVWGKLDEMEVAVAAGAPWAP